MKNVALTPSVFNVASNSVVYMYGPSSNVNAIVLGVTQLFITVIPAAGAAAGEGAGEGAGEAAGEDAGGAGAAKILCIWIIKETIVT